MMTLDRSLVSAVQVLGLTVALVACGSSDDSTDGSRGRGGGSGGLGSGFDNTGDGDGTSGIPGGQGGPGGDGIITNPNGGCIPDDISIWLVIDGSGSMDDDFGGQPRWNALRSALMDQDGVIARLQDKVEFAMTIYDGPIDIGAFLGAPTPGLCPQLVKVPVAPMNYGPIDAAYPQSPLGGSTPTHQGVESARADILNEMSQPDDVRSHYIVLATDGAPNDFCAISGGNPQQLVLDQTRFALSEGVKTFVISLAGGDQALTDHLNQVSAEGGTNTMPFIPDNKDALVQAFRDIIGDAAGCDLLAPQ